MVSWEGSRRDYVGNFFDHGDEFSPMYGVERWIAGRRAFLTAMLARDSIDRTPAFRDHFEGLARSNIASTIDRLAAGEA